MLHILNLEEAIQWCKTNLHEAHCYLSPLSVSINHGLLMEVDSTHFAIVETESFDCTWKLDKIWKLTDEEMKANDLYCQYRYKEHVVKCPKGYDGLMKIEAGFNL